LVGSLKLQVSFAEHGLFYRALLQKKPIILRSLQIVVTPYAAWAAVSLAVLNVAYPTAPVLERCDKRLSRRVAQDETAQ